MAIKQLSVFVENKQGALTGIMELLSAEGLNLRAMSIADTQDFGILRLIVSNTEDALRVLRENHCIVSVTPVIGIAVSDEPGALAGAIRLLADKGVNIEYMYAFLAQSKQNAYIVLRVNDNAAAEKILTENDIRLLDMSDASVL